MGLLFLDSISPISNPAGCYANGQIQAHGDRWREDDCTFCQCINGESHCVATACGQSCLNPVKVPGECCPMCEGKAWRMQNTILRIGIKTFLVLIFDVVLELLLTFRGASLVCDLSQAQII